MFDHCSYHLLDSLVPPSADGDRYIHASLLRLENICAYAIVRNEKNNETLNKIPAHLLKTLWKAYLRNEYYTQRSLDDLPKLLCHWPHEQFILKDVMPKFPPRLNSFASFWDANDFGPSYQNTIYLLQFYENVVNIIFNFSIIMSDISTEHPCVYKIRKIDLSGFYTFNLEDMTGIKRINNPFPEKSHEKLEIILDVNLPLDVYINDAAGVQNRLAHFYSNPSNSVVLKYSHVSLYGSHQAKEVTQLMEILVNNGTISISLGGDIRVSEVMANVFENNANQENILAVELVDCVSSLNFVQYFKNLVHLDLSNNNLHGLLDGLKQIHRGLLFLSLHNCDLRNMDLNQLRGSCHQLTLRELNISSNLLSYDNCSSILINLCKNLTNILQLDLGACDLGSWHSDEISLLLNSFKTLPNIVNLNLYGNEFNVDTVTDDIMVLKENPSLRYLELSLPARFTGNHVNNENDLIKSFCSKINAKMNNGRSQLLYVDFAPAI